MAGKDMRKLGKYQLKENDAGFLEIYRGEEHIITLMGADINTFDTEEEIEEELAAQDEDIDPFGNYGEAMAGQHDLLVRY